MSHFCSGPPSPSEQKTKPFLYFKTHMICFPVISLPSPLAAPPLAPFSPTTKDMLLFLKLCRPYLSTTALTVPSARATLLWGIFTACFLISFRSLLKCYLLSEAFPDHPIQVTTTSPCAAICYFCLSHATVWLTICFTYLYCLLTFSVSSSHNVTWGIRAGIFVCFFTALSLI